MESPRAPFKVCTCCRTAWPDRSLFLSDQGLHLIGYQVNYIELGAGLLLFNHAPCRTTLAVQASQFQDLYTGPMVQERRTGHADCPGYCLRGGELAACPAQCECASVRQILQIVSRWPKRLSPSGKDDSLALPATRCDDGA